MHENVAMLLNGGVKAVLIFMGMRSFAKNEMSKLPSGTASFFSGNRGSYYEHSGQAAGRVLPSWQGWEGRRSSWCSTWCPAPAPAPQQTHCKSLLPASRAWVLLLFVDANPE